MSFDEYLSLRIIQLSVKSSYFAKRNLGRSFLVEPLFGCILQLELVKLLDFLAQPIASPCLSFLYESVFVF